MRRAPARLSLVAAVASALVCAAACGAAPSATPPSPTPAPVASTPAPTTATSPSASHVVTLPASPSASPSPAVGASPPASPAVIEDETLLSILPAAVSGVALMPEPDAFVAATADPGFGEDVASAAFATAFDGADLASGVVAKLRPGRYSEAMFRDWRDTYDAGACGQAGGVSGHAQAQLGGRTVDITTCNAGLRVYHVWLPQRDVIVSLFSLGDRRFGEQVMAGLRP